MLSLAVLLAVVVGTLAQSVSGIGFSLVCGPLLVAALGPTDGVRLSVLLSLVLNVVLIVRLRRDVRLPLVLVLLVASMVTTPVWAVLAHLLPERQAALAAGSIVLVGVGLLAGGERWPAATGRPAAVGVGVLAAGTNAVAGVAGPVVAAFAANAGWRPDVQRASLQAYFLGLNVVALPSLGRPQVSGALLGGCLLALAVGTVLGAPLARRVPEPVARRTTLLLAAAGGLVVVVHAL